jgi:arylsulfatase
VRLEVPEGAGERGRLVLRGSAGVGVRFQPPDGTPCTVVFTVEVDGEVVDEQRVVLGEGASRDWRPVGGPDGVAFERGDEVVLRTSIEGCDGVELAEAAPAGFGALKIEEVVRKADPLPADAEHPSVVLIVVDTLRADHLSCLGSERAATPNVDALAARGVLYERAYATSPWTWPSTASILTGLAPERHGVLDGRSCVLSSDNETLAEAFFGRDWFTGGFSGNPLVDSMRRFDQGFETWDSFNEFRFTGALQPQIAAWIDAHAGQRFFLYLHLVDPHAAYDNRPEALAQVGGARPADYPAGNALKAFEERLFENEGRTANGGFDLTRVVPGDHDRWMRDEYLAGVLTADLWLGEILAQLERLGIDDRTVVAFTSDHGEELGDHGLVAHCSQLHEELVRVPLVLAGPGIPTRARR